MNNWLNIIMAVRYLSHLRLKQFSMLADTR